MTSSSTLFTFVISLILGFILASPAKSSSLSDTLFLRQHNGIGLSIGRSIPHTARFIPSILTPSGLIDVYWGHDYLDQSHKIRYSTAWRLQFSSLGNPGVLGNAWSLTPCLGIRLFDLADRPIALQLSTGLSYLSRKYDPFRNPENNVIGSHINNMTELGLTWQVFYNRFWNWDLGIFMTHFSNGSFQNPNLGVNIVSLRLNVKRISSKDPERITMDPPLKNKRIYWQYRQGIAIQDNVIGGPKHLVYSISFMGYHRTSQRNMTGMGLHLGYNEGEYRWLTRSRPENESDNRRKASDISIIIGNEWLFKQVGIILLSGYYLYDPYHRVSPIFFKAGFHWYPDIRIIPDGIFVFGNIKSHFFIADYLELGIGYRW